MIGDMNRATSITISDQLVKATQELSSLRDQIKAEKEMKEKVLREAIAPLLLQKEEAERALASAENRRKEMWAPFKGERDRLEKRERSANERDEALARRESVVSREEGFLEQKKKDVENLLKENRKASVQWRRANQKIEKLKNLQQTTLDDIEKEKEKLRLARLSYEKKEADITEREVKLSLDRKAATKFLWDRENELKKLEAKIADDRAKLKSAMEFAKQKYGIRSTRSE